MEKVIRKYYDVSDNKYICEECKEEYFMELVEDIIKSETPHAEYGEDEPVRYFLWNDTFYEVTVEIDWNRYDKQFYYMDGSRLVNCERITPEGIMRGK